MHEAAFFMFLINKNKF